jgi:hypothetical protein
LDSGHIANYVNNTNELEATNKVIKDEVTKRQLMPVMNFFLKIQLWVGEQSVRSEPAFANFEHFATTHTFETKDWVAANAWRHNNRKQLRFLPEQSSYVSLSEYSDGHVH